MGKKLVRYIKDYTLFDLETTGLSPAKDAVVEIAAVKVRDGKVIDEFQTFVDPERKIPWQVTSVHGITDDMVAGSPVFSEALDAFLSFADGDVLAGHNIHSFDLKFLEQERNIPNDYIDTLLIARACLPQLEHRTLGNLAQHYGIPIVRAHRALDDCRVNQSAFEKMGEEIRKGKAKVCPECGNLMIQRKGKYGSFFGCTAYPECRHTEKK